MTQNQIAYFRALNEKEHNEDTRKIARETLAETHRANVARETETHNYNVANIGETRRANLAREAETHRSNVANENLKYLAQAETARSNRAQEALKAQSNVITAKHYEASDVEQARHNLAQESLTSEFNFQTNKARRAEILETAHNNSVVATQKKDELEQTKVRDNNTYLAAMENAKTNRANAITNASKVASENSRGWVDQAWKGITTISNGISAGMKIATLLGG